MLHMTSASDPVDSLLTKVPPSADWSIHCRLSSAAFLIAPLFGG